MVMKYSSVSGGGIPFGENAGRPANPQSGQPFFNGEAARLELYTSSVGWQNIVQETPGIVNISGTYIESNSTNSISINGTNFATGAIAYAVGLDGIDVQADTTTVVSVASAIASFSGLTKENEPYDIKIVNPSNLYGILYESLFIDDIPIWITQPGTLGTYVEQSELSVLLSIIDDENSPLIFSILSGQLPPGLSISSSTGEISGIPSNIISNTAYSFTVNAFDGNNNSSRQFSIAITDRGPSWITSQILPAFSKNIAYSSFVQASDDDVSISYSIVSGLLPIGLSLNSSTGEISGTASESSQAIITIRATDSGSSYSDRQFTIPNATPVWQTTSIPAYSRLGSVSYQLQAIDDSGSAAEYSIVSGTLPAGLSMSISGLISGTVTSLAVSQNVVFRATDLNGGYSDKTLQLQIVSTTILQATTSLTFNMPASAISEVQVLAVGGGGGGGDGNAPGGGGGAGELITGTMLLTPGQSYSITIGGGGAGGGSSDAVGSPGGQTSIGSALIAKGGGRGAGYNGPPGSGGSGGGGTGPSNYNGGAAAGTQGTVPVGCTSYRNAGGSYTSAYVGGGGGGAGGAGSTPGAGGAGFSSSISGASVTYARGGDGAANGATGGTLAVGYGSGGGGGGDQSPYGQQGNAGIVIIKYSVAV